MLREFSIAREQEFFGILDLQNWPGQMCCEKTGIWRGAIAA